MEQLQTGEHWISRIDIKTIGINVVILLLQNGTSDYRVITSLQTSVCKNKDGEFSLV